MANFQDLSLKIKLRFPVQDILLRLLTYIASWQEADIPIRDAENDGVIVLAHVPGISGSRVLMTVKEMKPSEWRVAPARTVPVATSVLSNRS